MRSTMLMIMLMAVTRFAAAQEPTPPAPRAAEPAPVTRPAAPESASEIQEIEIIEAPEVRSTQDAPAPPDAVEPPVGRRQMRIVDGNTTIYVDEEGHMMELGDVMSQALEFNPELRAIRAEIQALVARLEQLEMKTATDVARRKVELKSLVEKHGELKSKYSDSSPELRKLDADIAAKKVELDYIVGVRGDRPMPDRARIVRIESDRGDAPFAIGLGGGRPGLDTVPDNIRAALDQKVSLEFREKPLSEVMEFITQTTGLNVSVDIQARMIPVTVILKDVTLRDALTAMADANWMAFIVRDYGIFATIQPNAGVVPGPSIPEGLPYSRHGGTPAPIADLRGERAFREGAHVERRKPDGEQADKTLDYVEGVQAVPAPTPKPAPQAPRFAPNN